LTDCNLATSKNEEGTNVYSQSGLECKQRMRTLSWFVSLAASYIYRSPLYCALQSIGILIASIENEPHLLRIDMNGT
jgi:hypothetical protein